MLKASAMTLNCPDDLKRLDQWVGYKLVQRDRDSKPTKIPINPHTTGNADSTDPTTWGTFSDVVEAFRRHNFAGVGYVFTENDPHVGTDLDGCRNPQTGEIAPWAAQVIKVMDSYTEISPSGTGVHIITRGKKAGKACKRGQFEMYDRDRFFTMTGDHLAGTPTGIETRDAEIAQVYAEYLDGNVKARRVAPPPLGAGVSANDATLINKAAGARNGAKFSRLWDGDWSEYPSQSEADLALSSLLV